MAEVLGELRDALAYTSALWVLQRLEAKGFVSHEKEGRAYRYSPLVQQGDAGGSAISRIVDKVFHGSASMLVAQLVSERKVPKAELERMRDILDKRLGRRGK